MIKILCSVVSVYIQMSLSISFSVNSSEQFIASSVLDLHKFCQRRKYQTEHGARDAMMLELLKKVEPDR